MLYPLKFKEIYKEKIWGKDKLKNILTKKNTPNNCGESWEISTVKNNISVVSNGKLKGNTLTELIEIYMDELVGDKVFRNFGTELPLLFKFIDANEQLSIQVHPDDLLAKERHNSLGKNEMWYIVDADEDAKLISGFNKELNKKIYQEHLQNGNLEEILNYEKVKKGEVFDIPAGRVHSTGAGILFAEVQQSSDLTYRIYDWNRKNAKTGETRELHTKEALNAIDFKRYNNYKTTYDKKINHRNTLVSNNFFNVNIFELDKKKELDYYKIDSFVVYMCLDGEFDIIYDNENKTETVKKGESVLIPSIINSVKITPKNKVKFLEIFV